MQCERDVDFLFEVGTVRHIMRTWAQFGGTDFANVAEHTFRVMWIAFVIAKHEDADIGRVLKLALIHDLPEVRTGDANYVVKMYIEQAESRALHDIVSETAAAREITDLWNEYEEQCTIEARIVKDADSLDCDFELKEQATRGGRLVDALADARASMHKKLHTRTAKALLEALAQADPHRWHRTAVNRLTAGDWRPEAEADDKSPAE